MTRVNLTKRKLQEFDTKDYYLLYLIRNKDAALVNTDTVGTLLKIFSSQIKDISKSDIENFKISSKDQKYRYTYGVTFAHRYDAKNKSPLVRGFCTLTFAPNKSSIQPISEVQPIKNVQEILTFLVTCQMLFINKHTDRLMICHSFDLNNIDEKMKEYNGVVQKWTENCLKSDFD